MIRRLTKEESLRHRRAVEAAENLLDVIEDGAADCPFCDYDDECGHELEWADGKPCPVLRYRRAAAAASRPERDRIAYEAPPLPTGDVEVEVEVVDRRPPGRPPLPPEQRRRRVDLRLAPETLLGLDVLAEARGTTRSGAVDQLVAEALPRALRGRKGGR